MTWPTTCSECGGDGATYQTRDAANARHAFHPRCFAAMSWFLDGHSGAPPKWYADRVERKVRAAMEVTK